MDSLIDTINKSIDGALANIHTALPAVITQVNKTTINVKPTICRVANGNVIEMPEFIDVIPIFFQGGNSYHAFPLSVGDYCQLIVNERCLDSWYSGQDNAAPREDRKFDYSDCTAIVGINPKSRAITIPKVIQMTGDTNQNGNYTHQGNMTHTGDYQQNGNYTLTGDQSTNGNLEVSQMISAGSFSGMNGSDMTSSVNITTEKDVIGGGVSLIELERRVAILEGKVG